jgi:hypothetical protein
MAQNDAGRIRRASRKADRIRRTSWKVDVQDRLDRVQQDIDWALGARGWSLWEPSEPSEKPQISPADGRTPEVGEAEAMREAEAVVTALKKYMDKATECLDSPDSSWRRFREWLSGGRLISVYESLHAAEANRILLLSSDQLAAILPVIREHATAYLPATDARLAALNGLTDLTTPTHRALAHVQQALISSVNDAHARAQAQERAREAARIPDAKSTSSQKGDEETKEEAQTTTAQTAAEASGAGSKAADAGAAKPPEEPEQIPSITRLTEMLGKDQQIAAMVMGEASREDDLRQSEVRRFRNVLLGSFAGLFIVVILLAILGIIKPTYFPLCLGMQTTSAQKMCPAGGTTPSSADLPLVLALGVIGAVLAVAVYLSGLKPAGVRYTLPVAQGLIKIPFGALTAMLGIIILSTQTSAAGILGSQAGLLTTAAIFGYSQQLFTRLIDKQCNDLESAASSTTKASP